MNKVEDQHQQPRTRLPKRVRKRHRRQVRSLLHSGDVLDPPMAWLEVQHAIANFRRVTKMGTVRSQMADIFAAFTSAWPDRYNPNVRMLNQAVNQFSTTHLPITDQILARVALLCVGDRSHVNLFLDPLARVLHKFRMLQAAKDKRFAEWQRAGQPPHVYEWAVFSLEDKDAYIALPWAPWPYLSHLMEKEPWQHTPRYAALEAARLDPDLWIFPRLVRAAVTFAQQPTAGATLIRRGLLAGAGHTPRAPVVTSFLQHRLCDAQQLLCLVHSFLEYMP